MMVMVRMMNAARLLLLSKLFTLLPLLLVLLLVFMGDPFLGSSCINNNNNNKSNNNNMFVMALSSSSSSYSKNGSKMNNNNDNQNQRRIALVTGANKGIGKEIVRLLDETTSSLLQTNNNSNNDNGDAPAWTIFLASRDIHQGNAAIEEILSSRKSTSASSNKNKNKIICCPLDLTDMDSILAAKECIAKEGSGKLHVLINNAAICFNDPTLYGKVPYTPFEQQADITVRTNFFGTLAVIETMLPLLLSASSSSSSSCQQEQSTATIETSSTAFSPRIINIASAAGRLSILKSKELVNTFTSDDLNVPRLKELLTEFVQDVENGMHASKGWPNTCYGMSKLGIIALTKILARELYPNNIMVNAVDPGYCATDQNNHQGVIPARRGAVTPVVLATLPAEKSSSSSSSSSSSEFVTGRYFFQEQEIQW